MRQLPLGLVDATPLTRRALLALAFIFAAGDKVAAARVSAPGAREITAAVRGVADEFFATTIETSPNKPPSTA